MSKVFLRPLLIASAVFLGAACDGGGAPAAAPTTKPPAKAAQPPAPSYPDDCPSSAPDSISYPSPPEFIKGSPSNPVNITDYGLGYTYYKIGRITTGCKKNEPVPEKCGLGSFSKPFYTDNYGTYIDREAYHNGQEKCNTRHYNWTGPEWSSKDSKWKWTENSCVLEELAPDAKQCTYHGPHVHRNTWDVKVFFFKAVPPPPSTSTTTTTPPTYPYPYPYPYPGHYPYPYPYPAHYPYPYPANYPSPPPPPPAEFNMQIISFAQAQQNVDQRIKLQSAVTCNGGQTAPCNTPEGKTTPAAGTAGPYVASMKIDSFTLTPPAGYSSPKQFKVISSPVGQDLASGPKYATMRFYAATRSGAQYSYTATATVSYYMRSWYFDGSKVSWQDPTPTQTTSAIVTCTPVSCKFSVIGSNPAG